MSTVLDVLRKAEEGKLRGGGGGMGGEPPGPPRRRRPRLLWLALGVLALVIAFLGGLQISNEGSDGEPTEVVTAEPASGDATTVVTAEPASGDATTVDAAASNGRPAPGEGPGQERGEGVDARMAAAPAPAPAARPSPPSSVAAPQHVPAMSEKRRQALERVIARREERSARREQRRAARQESQGLRDAIRSAETPEERNSLLKEFRERRRVARAERLAAAAEKRLELEAERARVQQANGAGRVPSTAPAPEPPPPAPAAVAAPAAASAPPPLPAAAPAPPPPSAAPAPPPPPPAPVQVASAPEEEGLRRAPSNAPQVRINILQWSSDPGRRFAYVSVEGNPAMTQVREGESYQGLVVKRILPEKVEFAHEGTTFLLRAN